jgi:outer membrane protein assembly factor BamB
VGYPLIVDGRVFVTVANGEPNGSLEYGSKLYALDAENGNDLWGPIDLGGTYSFSAPAYDTGRVFVVNYDGLLQAFDAASGSRAWSKKLPGQWSFTSPPTARDGVVYTAGAGGGGTLYAVSESDGALKWTASVANGDSSSPAVTGDAVYVSYPCHVYDFNPSSGTTIWHNDTRCSSGGGATPVVHDGKVYARGDNIILGAQDGSEQGAFTGGSLPAFAGSRGFFVNGGLEAHSLDTNAVVWHFNGEQPIVSNAIAINGVVYAASGNGTVYGVDVATGRQVWSGSTGGEIDAPDEHNAVQRSAIAEGNGLLLVPTMDALVAFG